MKQFESGVFEALLEFLHVGSCDLRPSLLPGLFAAAQYYQVEELRQVCVESMKQRGISPSCSVSSLSQIRKLCPQNFCDQVGREINFFF